MNQHHFKFTTLAFALTTIWTLYGFFEYFTEDQGLFHGLGVLMYFIGSMAVSLFVSIVLIFMRLVFCRSERKHLITDHFLYITVGIFNCYFFIIWLICLFLKDLILDTEISLFALGNLSVSIFIFFDVYYNKRIQREVTIVG
ncbi:hypothetical protein HYN48_13400 [Flavobacterium magnum]|uniref:Uncharacterized protein n=1 Tax=Flavobacterium magnum TaxID=2162713 RepID=A0A2S0RH67_9FLAO|nr:hypothetical protein HYN48_13400 [Flavobacterium magnum]